MKFYIIRVEWSQTDSEFRIVQAPNERMALARWIHRTPFAVTCYGEVDSIDIA